MLPLLLLAGLAPGWASAQGTFTGSAEIIPAQVERMYAKGMEFLFRTQTPDGSWPDEQMNAKPAITALAVVSLLAHGDDPNFGPVHTTMCPGPGLYFETAERDNRVHRPDDV